MWSAFSKIGQLLGLTQVDPVVDLQEIASVLDSEDRDDDKEEEENVGNESDLPLSDGIVCQQRTGIITALHDKHGFIKNYHKDASGGVSHLQFKRKVGPTGLRVGHQVTFLVYKELDEDWIVHKILTVDNFWDTGDTVVEEDAAKSAVTVECEIAFKNVIAKITGRDRRTIHADQFQFSLDSVEMDFIPVQGDWLVLQSLVSSAEQEADRGDTLLRVERVWPLRARNKDGCVSHVHPDNKQGIIDSEVLFTLDVCEPGYRPRVGDRVRTYCIESEQGEMIWRALRLIALDQRSADDEDPSQPSAKMLTNKEGITISDETDFGCVNLGQGKKIEIEVKNEGENDHQLIGLDLPKAVSQFRLIEPHVNRPTDLGPGQMIKFVFKVNARCIGHASELVVFKFSDFEIGRQLSVDVQTAPLAATLSRQGGQGCWASTRQMPQAQLTASKLLATKNGFIVAGMKPIKPASFVPVNLSLYVVPDKLTKLVLGSEETFNRREDVRDRVLDHYRFLANALSATNYVLQWDTLIHIEEIEHCVNISRYNTHAGLRRVDEYLSLEIPGLAERRPSLIVGDRVIAKEAWTDENSWASDVKTAGYEGFIHKVLSNEVLLKFSSQFHDKCSGVYELTFEASRTRFRREHQAVHVAFTNLGASWLFPSKVTLQTPQILITKEENYKKEKIERNIAPIDSKEGKSGLDVKSVDKSMMENACNVQSKQKKEDFLPINNKIPPNDCDTNGQNKMETDINAKNKIKTDSRNVLDVDMKIIDTCSNGDIDKNLNEILNIGSNVTNGEIDLEEIQSKPKESNALDHVAANIVNHKISPPRIPVVERFLKSGNCPKDKSPKEVKNMLQQLASMPSTEKPCKQKRMKTLEEIERSIIKESKQSNVLSGIKPLTDHINNDSFHAEGEKNNIDEKQTSKNKEKYIKLSNDKLFQNNQNESKQNGGRDKIKWNSNSSMKQGIQNDSYYKVPKNKRRLLTWFNHRLNHYQKEAIRNILRGEARPLPYVIFGPPGTGKTITLVETILQIYYLIPESRILVGTPSNSSADLVCERLIDSGVLAPGDLLRLVGHHYADSGRAPDAIKPYCGCADIKARDDVRDAVPVEEGVVNMSRHAIGRHRITVGTCNTLAVLYQLGFPRGHFTHVLIDEAGQATEPEILIPFAFLHPSWGQAVLAGDPLQLGPVVLSRLAEELGLGQSLLSRLLQLGPYLRDPLGYPSTSGYDPRLITRLRDNYRSLPGILELPNKMFYDGDLIARVCVKDSEEARVLQKLSDILPETSGNGPSPAILFHGIRGTNCQSPDSPSWHNPHEAVQAAMYLQAVYAHGLEPDDCGIITPYQAQVLQIRQMLDTLEVMQPKVGSVEEFQGQERMVMILSAVRSSPRLIAKDLRHAVGFVASPQRLNVAITRARALLIILGNPHLLARDPHWRTVIAYCLRQGDYTGCEPPSLPEEETPSSEVEAKSG